MRDLTPEYLLAALRMAIKHKGITYRELSEKLVIPLSTLKRHLASTNLGLDKLLDYCRAIDCSLDELQKRAEQLQAEDEDYFSHTQDEVFYHNPHLYDFYREVCALRGKDGYRTLKKKHGLTDKSVKIYMQALEMLDLAYLTDGNKIVLHGPLYYTYAEKSKLSDKYTELIKQQVTNYDECVQVLLSRMRITKDQLKLVEDKVVEMVLEMHSGNAEAQDSDLSDFTNVLLLSGPHHPILFSENGIFDVSDRFLDDIRALISTSGKKPNLSI